jgi:hypothetical protein
LVAVVLLLGVYVYDKHHEQKKKKGEEAAKILFRFTADDLTRITLAKGTKTIKVQKSGDPSGEAWEIVAPIHTKAEGFAVESLTDKLANLRYERIMAEKADDLAQFGLDPPVFTVAFQLKKGSGEVSFGTQTPIEYGTYTRIGKERKVYLVETQAVKALDKTLFDLRNKRLFTQTVDQVQRFVIDRKGGKWAFVKKEKRWIFEDDEGFKVDQDKFSRLFVDFLMARAATFETESSGDLKPFGLVKPKARISLSGAEKSEAILLGDPSKKAKKKIYAKMEGKSQVVTVDASLVEDLPKDRQALKEEEKEGKEEKEKERVKPSD